MKDHDEINHPSHYTKGYETSEYIISWDMNFLAGNVVKYVTRYPHKGTPIKDLKKAAWYLNRLIAYELHKQSTEHKES